MRNSSKNKIKRQLSFTSVFFRFQRNAWLQISTIETRYLGTEPHLLFEILGNQTNKKSHMKLGSKGIWSICAAILFSKELQHHNSLQLFQLDTFFSSLNRWERFCELFYATDRTASSLLSAPSAHSWRLAVKSLVPTFPPSLKDAA